MQSELTKSTESTEHNHYYPAGIPVTPQARRFGYPMDVYVTKGVWKNNCVWPGYSAATSTDRRLHDLLSSCFEGIGKGLATSPDMVSFTFKHWSLRKDKPKSKAKKTKLGGRLLLHPDTGNPWLLIFNPEFDDKSELEKGDAPDGEPETDREDDQDPGTKGDGDNSGLGQGDRTESA